MKNRNGHNRRVKSRSDASEIGRVRVSSKPGPDAEDRLRRLMSLMVRYATQDGSQVDLPTNESHPKEHDQAET